MTNPTIDTQLRQIAEEMAEFLSPSKAIAPHVAAHIYLQFKRVLALGQEQWVSVEERGQPTEAGFYLVAWDSGGTGEAYWSDIEWTTFSYSDAKGFEKQDEPIVTHWMPLPTPPVDDKGAER